MKKMADVAESRRSMRIDMRPKVLIRVMKVELLWGLFSLTAMVSLPLYFLKIKPYRERLAEEQMQFDDEEKQLQELKLREREEIKRLRYRNQQDMSLSTF